LNSIYNIQRSNPRLSIFKELIMAFSLGKYATSKYSIGLGGLILMSGFLTGCQEDAAPVSTKHLPEVSYISVQTSTHNIDTQMQARVVASRVAQVRPQVSGIVLQRLFEEGSMVKKGQLLYQINPATFQSAYNEAKANLNSAKASLETARLKDKRYANLLGQKGISQQDADDARATFLEAQANIERFQAALETAAINLEFTKIKASISGHIGISNVTEGALVTASQAAPLTTIRTLDPIYVDMKKGSTELLKLRQLLRDKNIKQGTTEVTIALEDGNEYDQKGQLKMQEVAVDTATGTVTLRAEFANTNNVLLPGMFVRASINEAIDENAILVPQQGIYHSANGTAYAYVINADNIIEKRDVTTINAVNNQWLIASGLSVDDKLLVEGTIKVRPGSEVVPVEVEMTKSGKIIEVVSSTSSAADAQAQSNKGSL
jgi:membrane fusion protein (multidrug efflux system)